MGGAEAHTWVVSHKDLVQLRRRSRPFRWLSRPVGSSGFADGEAVPGPSDVVWTSMVEMDEGFVVPESDSLQGSPGDFLAFRPNGTCWVVDADEADRSYELIEPRDDDGRTRVFISYARDDVKTAGGKEAFDTLKGLLTSSDDINVFDDGRLASGDLWRERIVDWIATAHVVVVVVGFQLRQNEDGVARNVELPLALMARAERDIKIVPVLLNDLDRGVTVRPLAGLSVDILDFNSPAGVLLPEPDHPRTGHINKASERIRNAVATDGKAVKTQWALWAETPIRLGRASSENRTVTRASDEPTMRLFPAIGSWSVESIERRPVLVEGSGCTVTLRRGSALDAVVDVPVSLDRLSGEVSSLAAADDGSALVVGLEGRFAVIDSGPEPRLWPTTFPTAVPGERPVGVRRFGRTYVVMLTDGDRAREVVIDSGGAMWPGAVNPSCPPVEAAAGADGGFVSVFAGRLRSSSRVGSALQGQRLDHWLSIDAARSVPPGHDVVVTAGVGRGGAGNLKLVVVEQRDGQTVCHHRDLPPTACRVAVARPEPGLPPEWVVVDQGDELAAWSLADLAGGAA